jgi:DNA-binding LacI/PurR family transcriptional regulator
MLSPAISAIDVPVGELGAIAAQRLHQEILTGSIPPAPSILFPQPRVILRESLAPPARAR